MSLWFNTPSLDDVNKMSENTLVSHCGIEITEISDDEIHGVMPVGDHLKQPFGIVHGGANCVLAETLGSIAANLTCDPTKAHAVGVNISTNHTKAVRSGVITGKAKPVHIGKSIQVWEIKTYNDKLDLSSSSTLTLAIVSKLGAK